MRKKSFQEKIQEQRRNEKKKIIRNALRGAAHPWTLEECRRLFSMCSSKQDKIYSFNRNIGGIFPLILDLVAHGWSLRRIERQMCLTPRMLWQWLEVREELAEMVRISRGLRGRTGVGVDADEAP